MGWGGEDGVNLRSVSLLFSLWDTQHSLVGDGLEILPIFERQGLFEGRADVTQQVSQTVTNWR